MKQIKTIKNKLDNANQFDAAVNAALQDGWTLTERKVLQPPSQPSGSTYFNIMLYTELERFTEPDECEDSPLCHLVENCARFIGNLADRNVEKKPEAEKIEKSCDNCRHRELPDRAQPCFSCCAWKYWEPQT